MPVTEIDPEADTVGPYSRLSSSQASLYNSCPRKWFYEKHWRLKQAAVPVLFKGRAVEEALSRTLRDDPTLLVASAPAELMSSEITLIELEEHERPQNEQELLEWASTRAKLHFDTAWKKAEEEWFDDERKSGDFSQLNSDDSFNMVLNGIKMHLAQILSEEDVCSQWNENRPWFVPPDDEPFTNNAIHPGYWFQGEYDLVYFTPQGIKIVDIKASIGDNDRSGDYVNQMRNYAMLWWATHDKSEIPIALEIWYLGSDVIKPIEVPSEEDLISIESDMKDLWKLLKDSEISIADFPAEPLAIRGFSAGGVSIDPPDGERCQSCEWSVICPRTIEEELPDGGWFTPPGQAGQVDLEPLGNLNPRCTIVAEVHSALPPLKEGSSPRITVIESNRFGFLRIHVSQDGRHCPVPENLEKGAQIRMRDIVPQINWKGEIELKADTMSSIEEYSEPEDSDIDLFGFRAKWNLSGKVVYTFERSGISARGKPWRRWGMMIADATGAISVGGFGNVWPAIANTIEPGDEIVVCNVQIDAWFTNVQASFNKNSTLHVIQRSST